MKICKEHQTPETLVQKSNGDYTYECSKCYCHTHRQKKVFSKVITTLDNQAMILKDRLVCTRCLVERGDGV